MVGVLCGLAMVAAGPRGPRAVVEHDTHDAGALVAGARVEHAFAVRNEGDGPLALRLLGASDGATAACDPVVPAGRTGRVRVRIDTIGLGGPGAVTVRVGTDDPARPRIDLRVRMEVRRLVVATPGEARFVFVRGAIPVTVPQTVRAMDGQAFRVREVVSTVPGVTVTPPAGAPRIEWSLGVTLGRDAPVGPLAGVVELRTDHPAQPRLAIAVSGFVRPVVAVTPPRLVRPDATRPWRATLHVRSFAEQPITLLRGTSDVPGLSLAVRAVEAGRVYAVDVEGAVGAAQGTIRLETSSDVEPVVEVGVAVGAAP